MGDEAKVKGKTVGQREAGEKGVLGRESKPIGFLALVWWEVGDP